MKDVMIATITRSKLYPTAGKNYRVAWKYLYNVTGLSVALNGFDRLESAIAQAKRHGATTIIKAWEVIQEVR